MDHAPFIIWSYVLGGLILAWAAISPVLRKRRVLALLDQLARRDRHDTNT